MTIGVGGSSVQDELDKMVSMTTGIERIGVAEHQDRVARAQALMKKEGISALYLDTSVNLFYFTGMSLKPTERLHGAIIPAEGPVTYLSPAFEEPKTRSMLKFGDDIRVWEEHEDPTALVADTIASLGYENGVVAVDPATPFYIFDGLRRHGNRYDFISGTAVASRLRAEKSDAELALMQMAFSVTETVQKAVARVLHEGMTTTEAQAFVQEAHRRLGATPTPSAPLILFGEASAYPHGVDYPQTLKDGDMVLLDLGCFVGGYRSDITRSYVFGEPTARQREVWDLEKKAQVAGFEAARIGAPCHAVDDASRGVIENAGFGKDYGLPGLPHRTGHGIGLEVHEEHYMVRNNTTPLTPGMCFSVEPTICIYGEFGIRLEDCAYMAKDGPKWFSGPCHTVDDPFGYEA